MIDPVRITSPIDLWLLDVGIRCGMLNCAIALACVALLVGYAIGRRRSPPALTAEERVAIRTASLEMNSLYCSEFAKAETLRKLLERTK